MGDGIGIHFLSISQNNSEPSHIIVFTSVFFLFFVVVIVFIAVCLLSPNFRFLFADCIEKTPKRQNLHHENIHQKQISSSTVCCNSFFRGFSIKKTKTIKITRKECPRKHFVVMKNRHTADLSKIVCIPNNFIFPFG